VYEIEIEKDPGEEENIETKVKNNQKKVCKFIDKNLFLFADDGLPIKMSRIPKKRKDSQSMFLFLYKYFCYVCFFFGFEFLEENFS
jgi:hypothetical protein